MDLTDLMEIEVPKVVSASKFEQRVTEAPSSISVVTAYDFKKFGYRTLAEALESLQGFHVSYDRNYAFVGTRGLNLGDFNGRVLKRDADFYFKAERQEARAARKRQREHEARERHRRYMERKMRAYERRRLAREPKFERIAAEVAQTLNEARVALTTNGSQEVTQ